MNIGEFTNPELNLIQLNNDIQSITSRHFQNIEDKFSKKIHNNDFILTFIKQIAEENKTLRDEMKSLKEQITTCNTQLELINCQNKQNSSENTQNINKLHEEIDKIKINCNDLRENSITLEIN